MTKPTAIVVTIALLIHALAGCCWHHGHAGRHASPATAQHGCPDHDQDQAPEEHDHGLPPAGGGCEGGTCVTVASRTVSPPSPWMVMLSAAGAPAEAGGHDLPARWALARATSGLHPLSTLFEFQQVLLI